MGNHGSLAQRTKNPLFLIARADPELPLNQILSRTIL